MSFYKNIGGMVHPSSKEELIEEISTRLDKGQYNLNDIDTSKITDMSFLFTRVKAKDLSHIDISLWILVTLKTCHICLMHVMSIN